MKIAENIRTLRREKGLTQEQLAGVLGVTTGAVYKWEAGLSQPELGMLAGIADFFDTSVDVIIGYEVRNNRPETIAERLSAYRNKKDRAGLAEADMALKKYPNNFSVVYGVASQETRTAVICGSFNRHLDKISSLLSTLENKGIKVLSPKNTVVVDNKEDFVVLEGDRMVNNCKWSVESRHLKAIRDCDMVIACNFDDYIGFPTAFEIGYAYWREKGGFFGEH